MRTTGSLWRSAAVAAIFALHPARVESVVWVSERKDVLSGALGVAALLAYVHYASRPGVRRMLGVVILTALAMLAKSMVVTWPAVMLLMDVWPLRRVGRTDSDLAGSVALPEFAPASPARLVLEKLPLFILAIGVSIATFVAQNTSGTVVGLEQMSFVPRLEFTFVNYVRYIGLLIWPVDLVLIYPRAAVPHWQGICALLLFAAMTAFLWYQRHRRPWLLFGWFWFLGTLVPVVGFVSVGVASIADRYSYIPHIGLVVGLVWAVAEFRFPPRVRPAIVALTLVLAAALGVATWRQSQHWRTSVALWTHTLSIYPDNVVALNCMGEACIAAGDEDSAIPHIRKAADLAPGRAEFQNTAGMLLMKHNRADLAVPYLRNAAHNPNNVRGSYIIQVNLIKALRLSGQDAEAEREYEALVSDPAVPRALVDAEFDLGAAIIQYRAYIAAHPGDAVAHNVLGVALARSGDLTGAIEEFNAALQINPYMSDVRDNIAHAKGLMLSQKKLPGGN